MFAKDIVSVFIRIFYVQCKSLRGIPKEIIKNNYNGFCYKLNDSNDLSKRLEEIYNLKDKDIYKIKLNFKKFVIRNYTKYQFAKTFNKII